MPYHVNKAQIHTASLYPEEELVEEDSSVRKEYDLTNLFEKLAKSDFRSRFYMSMKDREYIMEKGLPTIRKHAEDLLSGLLLQGASYSSRQGTD